MFHSRRAAQVHVVVRGVFVVGDLRARWVERVASAVGAGSVVISSVHAHLGEPRPALTPPRS